MAEKPEDLGLPNAVVNRIINEALPPQTNVSAEARRVIAKTASVFVLYATATAGSVAQRAGRKTLNSNDVVEAMEEMEFERFLEPLKATLAYYKSQQQTKKISAAKKSEEARAKPPLIPNLSSSVDEATTSHGPSSPRKGSSESPSPSGSKKASVVR